MESNGWLDRFLQRSPVQPSFKLHTKGNSALQRGHAERMEQIREKCKEFDVINIYKMDESGLFFRMEPRNTYLSELETRDTIRGTDFCKHKERVNIVMACNADGSH